MSKNHQTAGEAFRKLHQWAQRVPKFQEHFSDELECLADYFWSEDVPLEQEIEQQLGQDDEQPEPPPPARKPQGGQHGTQAPRSPRRPAG